MELAEMRVSSERIYQGKIVALRKDTVRLPNGREAQREVIEHPGAVAVLAVTEDDQVVMVRQFRYPLNQTLWELPAGKLERGEAPETAALRELAEETGYQAGDVRKLYAFYTTPGFTDEHLHLYHATMLTSGEQSPDDDEFVECALFSRANLQDMIAAGEIIDAKTLIGILHFLREETRP